MSTRVMQSSYMHWAKTQVHAAYNLGVSGVPNYPLRDLPVTLAELEITGDSFYGYAPLIAELAKKSGVTADRVFATIGTSMANHLAMAAAIEPGDEVLIEEPAYELLLSAAGYLGARITRFPRRAADGFALDPDAVKRALTPKTRLIVVTNLHNPGGALSGGETLSAIGKMAEAQGARVLVDEVYLDAAGAAAPRPAVHLGPMFIVTSSLTKVYGLSGLRCGWVLAEPAFTQRLWRLNDLFNVIPSHPAEIMSVAALRNLDKILARTRAIVEPNRELVREFLAQREDLEGSVQPYAQIIFPRLRRGNADDFCARLLKEHDTLLVPGRFFGMPEHFRLGMGVERETFREGLARVGKALDAAGR